MDKTNEIILTCAFTVTFLKLLSLPFGIGIGIEATVSLRKPPFRLLV